MHKIKDDPSQNSKVTNLNFQIALLMSMEATEHELLQRDIECSMAMLHENVLKKVKEATISFTKSLKSVTNSNISAMKRRLNELKTPMTRAPITRTLLHWSMTSWKLKAT